MTTQFEKDMRSPNKDLFVKVRKLLLAVPGVQETRKPRITTYGNANGGICHLRTMPHGIDIGFLKGAKLDDEPARLTGTGKVLRVLSLTEFDQTLCTYYLEQAVDN